MKHILLIALVAFTLSSAPCQARLVVIGQGDKARIDTSGFPPAMKERYKIMEGKCVRCHSLERIIVTLTSGVSPITFRPFDKQAVKAHGIIMARRLSGMNPQETKAVTDLLIFLLDEAAR